jgi:hypothetical protein
MTIPQPRRAKSSVTLRQQAGLTPRPSMPPPPLPTLSPTESASTSIFSDVSSRSLSTSSSGERTPPRLFVPQRHPASPRKSEPTNAYGLTERLQFVTSELESFVAEAESSEDLENVHVAVRVKPNFNKDREVWTVDPVRRFIGSKLGDFFFGMMVFI